MPLTQLLPRMLLIPVLQLVSDAADATDAAAATVYLFNLFAKCRGILLAYRSCQLVQLMPLAPLLSQMLLML